MAAARPLRAGEDKNEAFYQKLGFKRTNIQMSLYYKK